MKGISGSLLFSITVVFSALVCGIRKFKCVLCKFTPFFYSNAAVSLTWWSHVEVFPEFEVNSVKINGKDTSLAVCWNGMTWNSWSVVKLVGNSDGSHTECSVLFSTSQFLAVNAFTSAWNCATTITLCSYHLHLIHGMLCFISHSMEFLKEFSQVSFDDDIFLRVRSLGRLLKCRFENWKCKRSWGMSYL